MVSISASVAWWAQAEPQRLALVYRGQRISYAELNLRAGRGAALLADMGIQPGQVVALLMKNSAAFLELSLAISLAGAVLLPINYRLGKDEVDYILDNSGARRLFADAELRASVPERCPVTWLDEAAQADSSRLPGVAGPPPPPAAPAATPDTPYRLMYTSGTQIGRASCRE